VVRTDHFSLKYLLDQRLATIPQHHWVSKILGFDFSVEYKPGRANIVADALSRREEEDMAICAISALTFDIMKEIRLACQADPALKTLYEKIEKGELVVPLSVIDGLVLFQKRINIPPASSLLHTILEAVHAMGHEGVQKTLHHFRKDFHTPQSRRVVEDFIKSCSTCQRNKTNHLHLAGVLLPLLVPAQVWSDIFIDFVEGLPKVGGKSVILTVVDRLSKYTHFIPLAHPYTAETVAQVFFTEIVRLHGIPTSIVSDRDPVFTSAFWQALFRAIGSKLHVLCVPPTIRWSDRSSQ
jgi:hypothetical protein